MTHAVVSLVAEATGAAQGCQKGSLHSHAKLVVRSVVCWVASLGTFSMLFYYPDQGIVYITLLQVQLNRLSSSSSQGVGR